MSDRPPTNVMRRVWIAQCLCPARHAIAATAGEAASEAEAVGAVERPLRIEVEAMLRAGTIDPWCDICRAPRALWAFELGRTKFTTMAEARPALERSADEQALTRAVLGGSQGRA
jgi:hypothetical protein